ncbi:hypothetical protein ABZ733_09395 [Streptomyces longwoodensis]|uniref:hypothetical protein n=1 Tax=Streptomyces longwoodensis TaxID=68231 RepID=UPI00340BBC7A
MVHAQQVRHPALAREFTPVLREGLTDLLALTALRTEDPATGHDAHAGLLRAVVRGDAEEAARILGTELEDPFGGAQG